MIRKDKSETILMSPIPGLPGNSGAARSTTTATTANKQLTPLQRAKLSHAERIAYDAAQRSENLKQRTINPPKEEEKTPEHIKEKSKEEKIQESNPIENAKASRAIHQAKTFIDSDRRYKSSLDMNYGDIDVNNLSKDRVKELSTVLTPIEVDNRINEPGDSRKFELNFDEYANTFLIQESANPNHKIDFKIDLNPGELETANEIKLIFKTHLDRGINPTPAKYRTFLETLFLEKEVKLSTESYPREFEQVRGLMLEAYQKYLETA